MPAVFGHHDELRAQMYVWNLSL